MALTSIAEREVLPGCECQLCVENRERIKKNRKGPQIGPKFVPSYSQIMSSDLISRLALVSLGWAAFAFLAYQIATSKVESDLYDPYSILGIKHVSALAGGRGSF